METKRVIWAMWVMVCVLFISKTSWGKSVYAIASHSTSATNAYRVKNDGTIDFQTTVDSAEYFSIRATGLCVWPSIDRMFATYEDGGLISWGSTKTLTRDTDDEITTPESSLAGIVADEAKGVLYVVSRSGGRLYTYTFDIENDTLVLVHPNDPAYPNRAYRQLEGLESSTTFGLALDDDGGPLVFGFSTGLLYITDGTSTVRYYNTLTWELEGTVNMGRSAVGIDVDGDGHLYAGGYFGNPAHNYLMRYDLNDSNPNTALTEKDMGYNITDIIVDRNTGILYTTTRQVIDGRTGAVEVYDPAYWDSADPNDFYLDMDSRPNFGGPAGIAIGSQYKPDNGMVIEKIDDVTGCVEPNDVYQYEIAFHAGPGDEPNVVITDKLPEGVDFVSASPNTGTYYERPEHKYIWPPIESVPGYDPNIPGDPNIYLTLTVRVNTLAEPTGQLINTVEAESDEAFTTGTETTPVCCWDSGDIVYVNWQASGADSGTSWQNAYRDLQDAITRVNKGCGNQIWVAGGTYRPGTQTTDSFLIPANTSVYGGFAGIETSIDQRDIEANPTILSGNTGIYDSGTLRRNITVVKMGNNSLLSGFIIRDASNQGYGIYGKDVDFSVSFSCVEDNLKYGIYAENSNASTQWCTVKNNGLGIFHFGNNTKTINIEYSQILSNDQHGIYVRNSIPTIRNNQICINGTDASGSYYGLYLYYPQTGYDIRNNTVIYNVREGVRVDSSSAKDIRNCILYGNKDNTDEQLGGNVTAHYSCVWDPNHPNQTTPDGSGNISCYPQFAYEGNPNMMIYRLLASSPCIDKGDPGLSYDNQTDLDGEDRVYGTRVDMGADEAVSCNGQLTDIDIYNALDLDADGLVNYNEFNLFSQVWLAHDPNDPAVLDPDNPVHDPNSPTYISPSQIAAWYPDGWKFNFSTEGLSLYAIDLADLMVLIEDAPWLWTACWRTDIQEMQQQMMMMMQSMVAPNESEVLVPSEAMMAECGIPTDIGTLGCDANRISPPIMVEEQAAPSIETVEVIDPAVEYATILSLLDDIDEFIEAGGEDAKAWAEMKDILEQSLADMEVMTTDPNEI